MPDPTTINSMFARIAGRYDVGNRVLSGGLDLWWRHRLVRAMRLSQPAQVLDLATGSGDLAFAISRNILSAKKIIGMDFCQPMLDEAEAKQKAAKHGRYLNVTFSQGDGLNLPLPDAAFDAVSIAFGLRNMANRHRSLSEIHRVLRPGGRLYVLEFSQPDRWFRPIYLFYLRHILPVVAGLLCGDRKAYVYLNESIEAFPGREALSAEILRAGYTAVTATGLTFGAVALHEAVK
ncbi:MAG TPA: bifunctional demethylmenaquinone methyltransferase/2-methoxy-6-polyprenyl-1,4-benzoquinol methylase UbiE [Opitutaceae bacterium]|nr:bifunctional demethylmenaquinone methyltransferase/2-methoxy-6-polyprenyl-1,4-benzoquinol methylase UbiE [Opitutaceae bacterium]HRJ47277.1 bifunctional demethylmenaquinone methyltransferase/2-methoxy-6-polyprenyl-1,4-benzoquinol methylase UbiE [Opitutaceae bacterium]